MPCFSSSPPGSSLSITMNGRPRAMKSAEGTAESSWKIILDFLRRTDQPLLRVVVEAALLPYQAWLALDAGNTQRVLVLLATFVLGRKTSD